MRELWSRSHRLLLPMWWGCTGPAVVQKAPSHPAPPAVTDTGMAVPPDADDTAPAPVPDDTGWSPPEVDPGETPSEARVLPTPSPSLTVSDRIDPPGDVDWYAVDLDAGTTLWIAALAGLRPLPSPLAPRIEIRNAEGSVLYINRGMPLELGQLDSAVAFEALTDGTFFIGISAASPDTPALDSDPDEGGPEHLYSLRLERSDPFESEPHNNEPAALLDWLELDGHYAYLGDPFLARWPLFSMRADTASDRDLFPWTVRGEDADGQPADWELWSFSPWPGCTQEGLWTATAGAPGADGSTTLAQQPRSALRTDPLWRLARSSRLLFPDVGMLVAAPPGALWLSVDHDEDALPVGSACTGILAGWTTESIDRWSDLDGTVSRAPRVHDRGELGAVSVVWGELSEGEVHTLRIPVDPDRPLTHVQVQSQTIGYSLDTHLSWSTDRLPAAEYPGDPIDGSPDPAVWNLDTRGSTTMEVVLTGSAGRGAYLVQVLQTATTLP